MANERRQEFGRVLRQERERNGMSQRELAALLIAEGFGATGAAVGAWERGEYMPKDPRLVAALDDSLEAHGRLADAFGVLEEEELARRRLDDLVAGLEASVAEAREKRGLGPLVPIEDDRPASFADQIVDLAEQIEFLWNTIEALVDALRDAGVALPQNPIDPSTVEAIRSLQMERQRSRAAILSKEALRRRSMEAAERLLQAASQGNPDEPTEPGTPVHPGGAEPEPERA